MTEDTKIGGAGGRFPATHWSAVLAARSDDPAERLRAVEAIAAAYWKPIYKYVRIRWGKSNEDAKDLTQDFFAKLFEKEYLADFDPARARLRTFLRICADRFIANEARLRSDLSAAAVRLIFHSILTQRKMNFNELAP
jgi:DNA-directed RNA polymerase specialized sigma24 family protein